jgi:hypothetical protein
MIRKAAAVVILSAYAGAIAEIQAAGPFEDVRWWRAPITGGAIMGGAALLWWARHELERETDG